MVSNVATKTAALMSIHNICFGEEIRKTIFNDAILSGHLFNICCGLHGKFIHHI